MDNEAAATTNLLKEAGDRVNDTINSALAIANATERIDALSQVQTAIQSHIVRLERANKICEAEKRGRGIFQHGLNKLLQSLQAPTNDEEGARVLETDKRLLQEAALRVRLEARSSFRYEIKPDVSDNFVKILASVDGVRMCLYSQGNQSIGMHRSTRVSYIGAATAVEEAGKHQDQHVRHWQREQLGRTLCAQGEQERAEKELSEERTDQLRAYLEEVQSPLQHVSSWKALSSFVLLMVAAPEMAAEEGLELSEESYCVRYGWPTLADLFEGCDFDSV